MPIRRVHKINVPVMPENHAKIDRDDFELAGAVVFFFTGLIGDYCYNWTFAN